MRRSENNFIRVILTEISSEKKTIIISWEMIRSDLYSEKESWATSTRIKLKKAMNDKFIHLKTSRYEIIKLQCAKAIQRSVKDRKLSHHTNLIWMNRSSDLSEQDKDFWIWVIYVPVQPSKRNSHSCDHTLLQIHSNKTHTKRPSHGSARHASIDWHGSGNSMPS